MNTNPDETKLALWLEDELEGEELAAFERWVNGHPEHLAAREESRRWRRFLSEAIPAAEEPPYPDFFNHRILRSISTAAVEPLPAAGKPRFSWRSLLMPLAACAGLVVAFQLGMRSQQSQILEIDVAGAPKAIPVEPILYTPEKGVKAEWLLSLDASATVIVLNGVDAIPDENDFSRTVSYGTDEEFDSTAEAEQEVFEHPTL